MFDSHISGEVPEHRDFIYGTAIPALERMGVKIRILRGLQTYVGLFTGRITRGPKKGLKWFIPLLLSLGALLFAVRAGRFFPQLAASAVSLALFAPLYKVTIPLKDMTQEKSD